MNLIKLNEEKKNKIIFMSLCILSFLSSYVSGIWIIYLIFTAIVLWNNFNKNEMSKLELVCIITLLVSVIQAFIIAPDNIFNIIKYIATFLLVLQFQGKIRLSIVEDIIFLQVIILIVRLILMENNILFNINNTSGIQTILFLSMLSIILSILNFNVIRLLSSITFYIIGYIFYSKNIFSFYSIHFSSLLLIIFFLINYLLFRIIHKKYFILLFRGMIICLIIGGFYLIVNKFDMSHLNLLLNNRIYIWKDTILSLKNNFKLIFFGGAEWSPHYTYFSARQPHNDFLNGIFLIGIIPTGMMYFLVIKNLVNNAINYKFKYFIVSLLILIYGFAQINIIISTNFSILYLILKQPQKSNVSYCKNTLI